jgi:thiol-disulfide isomerase/thioredoxin
MTKPFFAVLVMVTIMVWSPFIVASADDHPTVRGKIERVDKKDTKFDLNELKVKMIQDVQFDPLPVPEDWATLAVEKRQAWMKEFQQSDKGQAYFAKRQKQFDDRRIFEIDIEDDGKFVVFDVPQGRYGLTGRVDKEIDGKKFAFEVFAQVDIGDVDEVQLDTLPVMTTRLLSKGESVSNAEFRDLNDPSKKIKLADLKGKFVLINFWSSESPPAAADMKMLSSVYEKFSGNGEFQIVSVSLDPKRETAMEFIEGNKISWVQSFAGGWNEASVTEFGVRSIPSYWFVNKSGKIEIANQVFFELFRAGKTDLQKILADSMAGKDIEKQLSEIQKAAKQAAENAADSKSDD